MGGNGRQVETRPWGSGQTISHRLTCEETVGDKRQDVEEADTPSNKGKQEGRWETRGNKTPGRRTHHPTQADTRRQDRGKADTPSKAEAPSITGTHVGDKGRQDLEKAETPSGRQTITGTHVGSDNGRQKGETRRREGGRTSKHRHTCAETMGDNGRQLVQWETRVDKTSGRQTTRGDKTAGRGTHHPKHAGTHVRRQWETRVDG